MVCCGIVVVGPDGVPRPGKPYILPEAASAAELFGGEPLRSLPEFLQECALPHLAATLSKSGSPAELYALYLEGRPGFLAALKAAGVSSLNERQTFANALAKAGKGGRLVPPRDKAAGGECLSLLDLEPQLPSSIANAPSIDAGQSSAAAAASSAAAAPVDLSDPDAMPARMRAALERSAREEAKPVAAASPRASSQAADASPPSGSVPPARALSAGERMLAKKNWVVAGDQQNNAIARLVAAHLERAGRVVHCVNPYDGSGKLHKSLGAVGAPIDVIDLIINSYVGMKVMEQAAELGVSQVFIQPGASSPQIEDFCGAKGIEVHHGCVLREL